MDKDLEQPMQHDGVPMPAMYTSHELFKVEGLDYSVLNDKKQQEEAFTSRIVDLDAEKVNDLQSRAF